MLHRSTVSSIESESESSQFSDITASTPHLSTSQTTSGNESSSGSSYESSSSLSESSDDEDDMDFFQHMQETIKEGFKEFIGTRESRFANRTSLALKWKEEMAYAKAEACYLAQKELEREQMIATRSGQKIEKKREKKAKKQNKNNRKKERLMALKAQECDRKAAKQEQKMTILAQLRLEHLEVAKANTDKLEPPWMSHEEAHHKQKLSALTSAENFKQIEMQESWVIADEYGRKVGTLPAINTPPRKSSAEQIETATSLVLRLALGEQGSPSISDVSKEKASRHKTLFTVNLKRFRHVEYCQGDKIGERGCIEFGKSILTGACPRLKELNLGWNGIKYRGLESLSLAFSKGAANQLIHLDLRSNGLDAGALKVLIDAIEAGGLPALQKLVLCGNVLGDQGGKAIAHAFLKGLFGTLHCLDVKSNSIRNDGCRAMFTAFTSDCFTRLAPKLELLDMRRNCINQTTAQTFVPCPKHISF